MEWLNYHHLLYFWLVAREGGLARAAARLRLAHPTVGAQVRALEAALGEKLLVRQGRRLVPTETGRAVYAYADQIFALGQELLDTVKGRPTGKPVRLVVGIAEVVPKLIAKRVLDPVVHGPLPVRLVCREDRTEALLADLASHHLDVVISESPPAPGGPYRAFSHLLGETGVTVFGARRLATRHRPRFPASLAGAPMLLPTDATVLRRTLAHWFESRGLRPQVVGEFDDSALLQAFGEDGVGLFAAPTVIEDAVRHQHRVEVVGRLPELRERFYAISLERRVKHPVVAAWMQAARERLVFGADGGGARAV